MIGFFLPFVTVIDEGKTESVSAFEMVFAGSEMKTQQTAGGTADDELTKELREVAPIIFGFWVPAILLVVAGTVAAARRRMTNVNATLGMLVALANVLAWFVLREAVLEVNKQSPGQPPVLVGLGTHALLAGGLLGFVGAAAVIFRPERAS